jgi:hypothetical protein
MTRHGGERTARPPRGSHESARVVNGTAADQNINLGAVAAHLIRQSSKSTGAMGS